LTRQSGTIREDTLESLEEGCTTKGRVRQEKTKKTRQEMTTSIRLEIGSSSFPSEEEDGVACS